MNSDTSKCFIEVRPFSVCPFVWQLISLHIKSSRSIHCSGCQNFLPFCGWINFYCVCIARFVYPLLCWWTLRLLPPFGYWVMLLWTWMYKYMFTKKHSLYTLRDTCCCLPLLFVSPHHLSPSMESLENTKQAQWRLEKSRIFLWYIFTGFLIHAAHEF